MLDFKTNKKKIHLKFEFKLEKKININKFYFLDFNFQNLVRKGGKNVSKISIYFILKTKTKK